MDSSDSELTKVLADLGTVVDYHSVGGGCISQAGRVRLRDKQGEQRSVFVKRNQVSFLENFRCEADGLRRLAEPAAICVPQPLSVGVVGRHAWLVTPWIETGSTTTGDAFFAAFGRQLAHLHHRTRGQRIGLDGDNFLGAARQFNTPTSTWPEFVQTHRLGFQFHWAVDQRLADRPLQHGLEQVIGNVPNLLAGREDQTCLLHGDLWSGDYLCDARGRAVIIDPAVYYGCREAEFGMLKLFGGCPEHFYQAYQDAWPLPQGWQRRARLYTLYHLLNHLNLFGGGYLGQCRAMVAELLQDP